MKQVERTAIKELLDQMDTLKAWLEDTGYPRRSAIALNEAILNAKQLVRESAPREKKGAK